MSHASVPRTGIAVYRRDPGDREFRLRVASVDAEVLLRAELSGAQGEPLWKRFPEAERTALAALTEAVEVGESVDLPSIAEDLRATAFCSAADELTVVFSDVVQRLANAEAEVAASKGELERFTYAISHDLKAPVRSIRLASQWLAKDLGEGLSDDARENLHFITSRGRWLSSMLDAILEHSRFQRCDMSNEPFELGPVVNAVVEEVRRSCRHRFVVPKEAWPTVHGDSTMVRRALLCLLENAARFHDRSSGTIELGWHEASDLYRVFVRDDGPGIPPERRERVFEMFTTLQRRDVVDTTGAGLTLCKALVGRWGGTIDLRPARPRGCEFSFTVPR